MNARCSVNGWFGQERNPLLSSLELRVRTSRSTFLVQLTVMSSFPQPIQ